MTRAPLLSIALLVSWMAVAQDPPPRPAGVPQPPADAKPLPPVQEPPPTAVERRDLLQRFSQPSPLEGIYRLRSFTGANGLDHAARGYLVIGQRHLSLQIVAPRGDQPPAVQSVFRSYRLEPDALVMTGLLGIATDADGEVAVEPAGSLRSVGYSLLGDRLRLDLDGGRALDFERIE